MPKMALELAGSTLPRLLLVLSLADLSRAGVISLENQVPQDHPHHFSVATSFIHFHGPVEGPEHEVKVPYVAPYRNYHPHHDQDHEDHGYALDYVAHPKYEFSYGVEDHHTGDFHGQKEVRDGNSVSGEYSVKEPGGGVRVVSYRADEDGFRATVHTSGVNDHSGGVYGGQGHVQAQGHDEGDPQEDVLQEYATAYSPHGGY